MYYGPSRNRKSPNQSKTQVSPYSRVSTTQNWTD